jgi:transcriptional regulator of acetoin/glycerol metabolism
MKTAKLLGISRSTLYEKCEKHNLSHFDWNSNC